MKGIKKAFLLLMAVTMFVSPIINVMALPLDGYKQVANTGGCNSSASDGVTVCKKISESNLENYFDITLSVETTSKIEEITKAQDLAVVLVMDISNTMNDKFKNGSSDTKLKVAKDSANEFINKFYEYSKNSNAIRQIGLVTFNRDANDVFGGLKNVNDTSQSTLNKNVNNITAPGVVGDSQENREIRWTNMEAGLKRANDLLNKTSVKNKYVIFLTDGLPTTYIKSGYEGYTPRLAIHDARKQYVEGNFYNFEIGVGISSGINDGTNYSEFGARKAEIQAYNMKNNGIKIYSIGVGITTQYTLYHFQYEGYASTVDTDKEVNNYKYTSNMTYRASRYYTILPGVDVPSKDANINNSVKAKYNNTSYYKTWLSEYIGSDTLGTNEESRKYYHDSDNTKALEDAYNNIFEDIKEMTSQEINASWVAEDPMNASGAINNIEFVGLYDDNMVLKDKLNINNTGESDTASYDTDRDTISWDLKNSTRTGTKKQENGKEVTYYKYEIKYRIRLENELDKFIPNSNYFTNGNTYLDYVVIENINGENVRTDKRTVNFPIPEVVGYLGRLEFNKISNYKISNYDNSPLKGVKFKLVHDSKCPCMEEEKHIDEFYFIESLSDGDGKVIFDKIPSGHNYKLYEESNDGLHEVDTKKYDVKVSYGETTTSIKENVIVNNYIKKNLTIEKEVQGIKTDKTFTFSIEAMYKGNKLTGTYNVSKIKGNNVVNSTVTFVDGKITFTLMDGEKIIIKDLPYTTEYIVKEIDTNGFVVKYQVNNNEIKIFDINNMEGNKLDEDMLVKFINVSSYELPATGSSGMLILIIIGSLLLIGPVIYIGYDIYKKKGKLTF